jgi:hypothetical protein
MKSKLILLCVLSVLKTSAQRQADAILIGNSFFSIPAEAPYANSIITFDDTSLVSENASTPMVMSNFYSSASYADKNGNLLFASNGWRLLNSFGEVLSYKLWHDDIPWPGESPDTTLADLSRGPLFLPNPSDTNQVYLFYGEYVRNFLTQTIGYISKDVRFCYALLDVPSQSLISQGNVIFEDTTSVSDMVALRHGNGRDWWIYKSGVLSNQFYRGLLSVDGLSDFELITIAGIVPREQTYTLTHFTQDGNTMAHFSTFGAKYCQRYDIDRCTGNLSNPRETDLNPMFRPADFSNFILSPDGSKFYGFRLDYNDTTYHTGTYQYDFEWDSLTYLSPDAPNLFLSPNNKEIYIITSVFGNGTVVNYLTAIEHPDSLGLACSVITQKYPLQNGPIMLAAPNFANYRLGPLVGSECDPLSSNSLALNNSPEPSLSVFPNPNKGLLQVRVAHVKSQVIDLIIYNNLGIQMFKTEYKNNSITIDLESLNLSQGIYFVEVSNAEFINRRKFIYTK